VRYVTEDPRLLRARAIPAAECSRKATANVLETGRNSEKDVKFNGTNSISHLESTTVSKNELKTKSKRSRKTCCEYAKEPKQTYERVRLAQDRKGS
jgi:hypothetical protein